MNNTMTKRSMDTNIILLEFFKLGFVRFIRFVQLVVLINTAINYINGFQQGSKRTKKQGCFSLMRAYFPNRGF
jgi:hypothetical protein